MDIQEHVPLAPYTTFQIGGEARYFARIESLPDLYEALAFAGKENLKTCILGGGSNILVDDAGFDGLVIKIELRGVEMAQEQESVLLVAAAGESWDQLVGRVVEERLWGIENLSGIPGSVGGAVVQNIGAYGAALSQTLEWVEVYDRQRETVRSLTTEVCKFGYRDSIFKQESDRYVVLHAAVRLSTQPNPNLSYKDLAGRFTGSSPALGEIREAVLEIRRNKFPDLTQEGSAGSFFKNPTLPSLEAKKLQEKYPEMPLFPLPESPDMKIPLGWLLDYRHGVLDMREVIVGGARLYEKQFLVVTAKRGTQAKDVKKLAETVQEKVFTACGLKIQPEVHIL